MASPARNFELIGEQTVAPPAAPQNSDSLAKANMEMLLLALRALSQRAMTAVTNLFTLGLVVAVWVLLARVLPDPTPMQLGGIAGFAAFCLAIDVVRRK